MLYNLVRYDGAERRVDERLVRALQIAETCEDHALATACDELRRASAP
jgi:hypothetical protein